jgi:hypothetical protein
MSKFKIKTDKQPLSENDITSNMNFDKFYAGYSVAGKASWLTKGMKTFLGGTAVTVVVVTATFVIYKSIKHQDSSASQAFIDPPLPELNSVPDNFIVDNSKDTTIVYKTGSVIYVPANAFKTKDGKDAKKKIKVKYREFHDQVDFIFSGIPMNYDSAGIVRPFESAGMFEVLAFEDDSIPVYLKDGKTLKVNLLSHSEENKFNVYYLDTVAKKWEFKEHETRFHKEDMDRLSKEKEEFLAKHGLLDPNKLITPKRSNPALNNFTIDYDKEEFPELAVYDGIKFEVNANDPNYTTEFTKTVWEDVFISRHPDGKNYILTFKINKQSSSITANPVFDEQNFEEAMKEYEKIRLHHANVVKAKADSLSKLESNAEAHLLRSNYNNDKFEAYVQAGSIYRSIVVGTTGLWNFDRPLDNSAIYAVKTGTPVNGDPNYYGERVSVKLPTAYFINETDGKRISVRGVWFMKRSINATFPIAPNDFTEFPVTVVNGSDLLLVVANNYKVYFLKDEKLKNTDLSGKEINFMLKEVDCTKDGKERNIRATTVMANLERIKEAIDI